MVIEHCYNCKKSIDSYRIYEDDQFLLDCELCNKSFCTKCATKHIHFERCISCGFFHSTKDINWCKAVDMFEQSSDYSE